MSTAAPAPVGAAPPVTTTTNTVEHIEPHQMTVDPNTPGVHCPGAWVGDEDDFAGASSPTTTIQELGGNIVGAAGTALQAAGDAAVKYLPASVMTTFSTYAPASMQPRNVTPPPPGTEHAVAAAAPPLEALSTAGAVPPHSLTEHPLPEPTPAVALAKPTGATAYDTPLPPSKGHSLDTVQPMPNITASGIDTARAFISPRVRTPSPTPLADSVTPYSTTAPTSTPSAPAAGDTAATVAAVSAPAMTSTAPASVNGTSPAPYEPSSIASVKSGVIGASPVERAAAAPAADGPSPPPKEGEDMSYLAPHIRHASSTHTPEELHIPTPAPPVPSKVAPAYDAATPVSTSSGEMSPSSPKKAEKIRFRDKLKGEVKVFAGKLQHDKMKINEGKALLGET